MSEIAPVLRGPVPVRTGGSAWRTIYVRWFTSLLLDNTWYLRSLASVCTISTPTVRTFTNRSASTIPNRSCSQAYVQEPKTSPSTKQPIELPVEARTKSSVALQVLRTQESR